MALSPELPELAARVRNWGRWGDDDQIGTANLIDGAATRRGAACVQTGERISLAVPLREDGIQMGQPAGRVNAFLTPTSLNDRDKFAPGIWLGTDDHVAMSTCAATHIDGISHVHYEGRTYGDKDPNEVIRARGGAKWCGVETLPPLATRGILLDVARQQGVETFEGGTAISADMLQAALDDTGLNLESGDILCIRTGDLQFYFDGDRKRYAMGSEYRTTGLGLSCTEWFHDHAVAGAFIDCYTYEVMPPESGNWDDLLAVHMVQLRDMGMLQGQNWNFEPLGEACAADRRYDFFLVAAGEPIVGATSAPVHPVAIR
jgi:kynurenine formamidase